MDAYGCFRPTPEDFAEIKRSLKSFGTLVFPYSGDEIGCVILLISTNFTPIGIMPFGGNPNGSVYIGVYGRGLNHLPIKGLHPNYIKEKLGVTGDEAEWISQLWNYLWEPEKPFDPKAYAEFEADIICPEG